MLYDLCLFWNYGNLAIYHSVAQHVESPRLSILESLAYPPQLILAGRPSFFLSIHGKQRNEKFSVWADAVHILLLKVGVDTEPF